MSNVLHKICADKRKHVDIKMSSIPLEQLKGKIKQQESPRGFIKSLGTKQPALITEVKKASPSKGIIREDFNPVEIAKTYEKNDAACLSVLTDEPYFQGHDDYFTAIKEEVSLPMLRKDFMIDPYQIYESRALGADCILLIMACLEDLLAKELYTITTNLGMDALFEVHDEIELDRALALAPQMVGVNNRNLKTLDVNLETGMALGKLIPDNIVKVAESGIYAPQHIKDFQNVGYQSFLIGESLMRQNDIGAAVRELTHS